MPPLIWCLDNPADGATAATEPLAAYRRLRDALRGLIERELLG